MSTNPTNLSFSSSSSAPQPSELRSPPLPSLSPVPFNFNQGGSSAPNPSLSTGIDSERPYYQSSLVGLSSPQSMGNLYQFSTYISPYTEFLRPSEFMNLGRAQGENSLPSQSSSANPQGASSTPFTTYSSSTTDFPARSSGPSFTGGQSSTPVISPQKKETGEDLDKEDLNLAKIIASLSSPPQPTNPSAAATSTDSKEESTFFSNYINQLILLVIDGNSSLTKDEIINKVAQKYKEIPKNTIKRRISSLICEHIAKGLIDEGMREKLQKQGIVNKKRKFKGNSNNLKNITINVLSNMLEDESLFTTTRETVWERIKEKAKEQDLILSENDKTTFGQYISRYKSSLRNTNLQAYERFKANNNWTPSSTKKKKS